MVVRFLEPAEQDFVSAADWYRNQRVGLELEFMEAVRVTLLKLAEDPSSHPAVAGPILRRRVLGFPYDVMFAMDRGDIVVVAIMHHHRHPSRWRKRL